MKSSSRRKFIKHTTLAAGAALTLPKAARAVGANEKITVGNIAIRTGEMLHFDPENERMENSAKANKLVRREYREHWGTPKGV